MALELTAPDAKTRALSSSQTPVWIFALEMEIVGHSTPPLAHLPLSGKCILQKPGKEKGVLERPVFHRFCFVLFFSSLSTYLHTGTRFLQAGRVDWECRECKAGLLGH